MSARSRSRARGGGGATFSSLPRSPCSRPRSLQSRKKLHDWGPRNGWMERGNYWGTCPARVRPGPNQVEEDRDERAQWSQPWRWNGSLPLRLPACTSTLPQHPLPFRPLWPGSAYDPPWRIPPDWCQQCDLPLPLLNDPRSVLARAAGGVERFFLMDRCLIRAPLLEPRIAKEGGRTRHPAQQVHPAIAYLLAPLWRANLHEKALAPMSLQ
ncbi:hypothetical protein H2248_004463 [Termitomyces sp. 'cryptogamus']|nr:hypothetical protein H2248_004463 [Termitomyces sp. 'cryptogamus']